MKSSKNMKNKALSETSWKVKLAWYENSDSQLFRNNIRIQSGPDAFAKSKFVMTFLKILGVTEISGSFEIVLKEKAGKKIPESSRLEFIETF